MSIEQKQICYSPYPPTDYSVRGGKYWAGYGARTPVNSDLAVWNLLWLSEPSVDSLLVWHPDDVMSAPLDSPILQAAIRTADENFGTQPVRQSVTSLLPSRFWQQLAAAPKLARALSLHKLLGAEWFRRVEARAAAYRGVLEHNGKVLQVNFSRPVTRLSDGPKLNAAVVEL